MAGVCMVPGCPTLTTSGPRCVTHTRARDRTRGTSGDRGYDYQHQRVRAGYQTRMNAGESFCCWRCGEPIDPTRWHLGHDDHDRTRYRGPECVPCNTAAPRRISQP